MRPNFLFIILLSLGACGFASKPDPRVAVIRQQHQQLLAKQKAATGTEESVIVGQQLGLLVQQSNNIQQALDQLDLGRSQEAAQVQLVTNLASQEATLLEQANLMAHMSHLRSEGVSDGSRASDSILLVKSLTAEMDTTHWPR